MRTLLRNFPIPTIIANQARVSTIRTNSFMIVNNCYLILERIKIKRRLIYATFALRRFFKGRFPNCPIKCLWVFIMKCYMTFPLRGLFKSILRLYQCFGTYTYHRFCFNEHEALLPNVQGCLYGKFVNGTSHACGRCGVVSTLQLFLFFSYRTKVDIKWSF